MTDDSPCSITRLIAKNRRTNAAFIVATSWPMQTVRAPCKGRLITNAKITKIVVCSSMGPQRSAGPVCFITLLAGQTWAQASARRLHHLDLPIAPEVQALTCAVQDAAHHVPSSYCGSLLAKDTSPAPAANREGHHSCLARADSSVHFALWRETRRAPC